MAQPALLRDYRPIGVEKLNLKLKFAYFEPPIWTFANFKYRSKPNLFAGIGLAWEISVDYLPDRKLISYYSEFPS